MTTMPDVASRWVCWGWEIIYFGGSRVHYNLHSSGMFWRPRRSGRRLFIQCQICPVFPIRQAVPVGLARARFLLLGSLGSVFHRQKTVYWQIQYIYIYYTPFCGSREAGMGGWHWMDSDDVPSDYLTLDNIYCAIANITRKVYIYSPRKD